MNKMTAKNIPTLIANIGKVILLVMAAMLLMAPASSNGQSSKYVATTNTLKPQILPQSAQPAAVVQEVKKSYPTTTKASYAAPGGTSGLIGALGYSRAGGNCVNEPGVNNPRTGNPINWASTSYVPRIGATVLFTWNHTGVVTGIWGNGDVEVRHQNCSGCPHRYPPSMIRGYR